MKNHQKTSDFVFTNKGKKTPRPRYLHKGQGGVF